MGVELKAVMRYKPWDRSRGSLLDYMFLQYYYFSFNGLSLLRRHTPSRGDGVDFDLGRKTGSTAILKIADNKVGFLTTLARTNF
jgi:hypothetical protein